MATAVELLAGVSLARRVWHDVGILRRNVIVLSLVGLVSSLLVNLFPLKVFRNGKWMVVANDGARARAALRAHHSGTPPVAVPVSRSTNTHTGHPPAPAGPALSTEVRRDVDRARTSVPPPPPPGT